jgi:hypothetical protein
MSDGVRFTLNEDEGKNDNVWKAVAIGLAVGATAVVGTVAVVASHIAKSEGLSGGALITSTLATIGGGSIDSGGDGMVGGLINLCIIGGSGVAAGAAGSVMYDTIEKSTGGWLSDYL